VLARDDISCFVANWDDKASNIAQIARTLNIGLESIVFLDDNPFERNLVRERLPAVAVPEPPEDPALVPQCLADAGYFESVRVTNEDLVRVRQYRENQAREAARSDTADLSAYLETLQMELRWSRFDRTGLARIVQLINKTNQFNLTTRRYSEEQALAVMADSNAVGLQFRLLDRFGDNGVIAIVIGRLRSADEMMIDTWLMSCRVLGRGVEQATLAVVAERALALGAHRLIGEYRPTERNTMVRDHYRKLGFAPMGTTAEGRAAYICDLVGLEPFETRITVTEG